MDNDLEARFEHCDLRCIGKDREATRFEQPRRSYYQGPPNMILSSWSRVIRCYFDSERMQSSWADATRANDSRSVRIKIT